MTLNTRRLFQAFALLVLGLSQSTHAAVGLDRTRVIFDGGKEATSVNITNNNTQLPYLAQGWIEDEDGKKITTPLIVLPPVQRLEPGKQSQVKVQALPAAKMLPQDRETVFYFNLREIPPRSDKANTLQIALQTRIKLFYRPQAIAPSQQDLSNPWQEKLTLTREGEHYKVNNPTPYYVTLVDARSSKDGKTVPGFEPLMVPPKGALALGPTAKALGTTPYLSYVNDYGGRPVLAFTCSGDICKVNTQASPRNE
ncbi:MULTISPECIES: fimbria/pilus periplasmic chaperone [Pseudomonas fluorescens group]|uniref:Exported fimbrial chaperone n=2 Tax=Pseudomonas fluorescens TaxID=294 RepID=C3K847_PSEFS|nr:MULTISPECIES: fimbria/pilus periplasmic chaperone [Pseudomonas fluorescens group]KJZ57498.1 molecular chaperone [Pseudomonas marginalis]KJZ61113.1 molecular chaperone [Pseudomonas marginalis]MBZ6456072.1 fimbria/pilus periplasmic chaperone [Pseudomonas fluorescens group sp.]MBZ6462721.1 fimbria/pilus periplasmic chaperone [Pseudomonas fluorescens group sp.]MBZ6469074.1 fimbria/pilus periplasmic chaperone [Pseudomonas fluorescens group sp.]